MPRGAQVVYPKDLGPILMHTDVRPGARVLEAGTGSGALTMALCRGGRGDSGRVVSYELREEHRAQAVPNIEAFFGKIPDIPRAADRRRPRCRPNGGAVRPGACSICPSRGAPLEAVAAASWSRAACCARTCPTTIQVQQFVLAFRAQGFLQIETFEVLRRCWHVTERSVRPDHRMVGHTGFSRAVARRIVPSRRDDSRRRRS